MNNLNRFLFIYFCIIPFFCKGGDNEAKRAKSLRKSTHIVKIKMETEHKSQSLESYYIRLEKLEDVAKSRESSKKVAVDQQAWTIYMIVEQKRLNKKQARIETDNLVTLITQEVPLQKIEIECIIRKRMFIKTYD
jgi:hypothetical protein